MLVLIAGAVASGKAALSLQLASRLDARRTSFGDFVRTEARHRSLSLGYESLQALGDSLIGTMGWNEFCGGVMNQTPQWHEDEFVIVDGVRHVMAVTTLLRLAGRKEISVVFVQSPETRQLQLLRERGVADFLSAESIMNSPNESEVELVRSMADMIVSSDGSMAELVEEMALAFQITRSQEIRSLLSSVTRASGLAITDLFPMLRLNEDARLERLQMLDFLTDLLAPALPPTSMHHWLTTAKTALSGSTPLNLLLAPNPERAFDVATQFLKGA